MPPTWSSEVQNTSAEQISPGKLQSNPQAKPLIGKSRHRQTSPEMMFQNFREPQTASGTTLCHHHGKHKLAKRPFYGRSDTCGGGLCDIRRVEGVDRASCRFLQLRSQDSGVLHDHRARTVARYSRTDVATGRGHDAKPAPTAHRPSSSAPSTGTAPTQLDPGCRGGRCSNQMLG